MSKIEFTPDSKPRKHQKKSSKDWLDFEEPIIAPVMGMRGSGKGGMMDYMAQKYFDEYFTVLHIWSARSAENLYWAINKNCGLHFRKIKQLLVKDFIILCFNHVCHTIGKFLVGSIHLKCKRPCGIFKILDRCRFWDYINF